MSESYGLLPVMSPLGGDLSLQSGLHLFPLSYFNFFGNYLEASYDLFSPLPFLCPKTFPLFCSLRLCLESFQTFFFLSFHPSHLSSFLHFLLSPVTFGAWKRIIFSFPPGLPSGGHIPPCGPVLSRCFYPPHSEDIGPFPASGSANSLRRSLSIFLARFF